MTNSTKIMLVVGTVCTISLVATLNLIRREQSGVSPDNTSNRVGSLSSAESTAVDGVTSSGAAKTSRIAGKSDALDSKSQIVNGNGQPGTADASDRPGVNANQQNNYGSEATATNQALVPNTASTAGSVTANQTGAQTSSQQSTAANSGNAGKDVQTQAAQQQVNTAKAKLNFPGIDQREGRVMVRDVRNKSGQGEDQITVRLTVTDDSGEVSGLVWIIGEYMQHGTTGVMFMPSHEELKLSADGKPQNPKVGTAFLMRSNTEKKFTIRRPGFEGEELTAIRVGVLDKKTGELHMARMLTRQSASKSKFTRAKVELP